MMKAASDQVQGTGLSFLQVRHSREIDMTNLVGSHIELEAEISDHIFYLASPPYATFCFIGLGTALIMIYGR
jgi:hypothetical protein